MKTNITNYLVDELTADQKTEFLLEVIHDDRLQENFIAYQHLITLINWSSPNKDEELARRKLSEFMTRIEKRKNK